ncbi:hypothetical protein O0L34_g7291 [Tuta absoluta]|nr:hypothetical protein O0L34_g7291 [Tuta absoluta]
MMMAINPKKIQKLTLYFRSASCSHGWLRWTMQCIFGTITIASFILIVCMSISNNVNRRKEYRCKPYGCRVVCYNVPYFDSFLQDLNNAIRQVEADCPNIIVELNDPMFSNYTIPRDFISKLRSNIHELNIVGGNMKFIAPHTFMTPSASNIERLYFEGVTISNWVPESFIGLTNLQELCIEHSYINNINQNALQAVDNTLTTLSIKDNDYWHPTNLTGTSNLEVLTDVYFSYNNFNNILNRNSFAKLKRCRNLYLDNCRINTIGQGTFDHLKNIEMLFLNNNFLIILPPDIFSKIMTITPLPRVNLQDNQWFCGCNMNELRNWYNLGIFLVDPLCYYPPDFRDLPFSLLEMECGNETYLKGYHDSKSLNANDVDAVMTGKCNSDQDQGREAFISPNSFLTCSAAQLKIARYAQKVITSYTQKVPPPFSLGSLKPKIKKLIRARFAMQSDHLSMIEISTEQSATNGNYGLVWYQNDCPEELYCVTTFPTNMRVYNVENNVEFTFCPIVLRTGEIANEQCIIHTFNATDEITVRRILQIILYVCTAIIGTVVGACILYTVIRKFPSLLKGSDRILFVKHKNVEALVLPPKVPLRTSTSADTKYTNGEINNAIFTVPERKITCNSFVRVKSTRSNKSSAPSYISAMQPTEEQLAEWRLRHHFDNNLTITSVSFDVPYSLLFDNESMYCSIGQSTADTNYESLKNDK